MAHTRLVAATTRLVGYGGRTEGTVGRQGRSVSFACVFSKALTRKK